MMTPVYTIKEVAAILKVSVRTVHELIATGRLQSTKIAGNRRFTEKHINELIREGEA